MLIMLSAFSLDTVAYAFVGQIIYVNSMNYVIFNMGPRLYEIQIVCEDPRAIERFIIEEIGKSATISKVIGGYSQADKIQLDCVCNSATRICDKKLDTYVSRFFLPIAQEAVFIFPVLWYNAPAPLWGRTFDFPERDHGTGTFFAHPDALAVRQQLVRQPEAGQLLDHP